MAVGETRQQEFRGRLVVVGTGIRAYSHLTPEARYWLEKADKVLYVVGDALSEALIRELKPSAESLMPMYDEGKRRLDTYEEMINRTLDLVRQGFLVCLAAYGHPGVFAYPSHAAIERARKENYEAWMLPGVSTEDCLFADLGLDPASQGCQSFEATDFLLRERRFDPSATLILWQVHALGEEVFSKKPCDAARVKVLAAALARHYGADHKVICYRAPVLSVEKPDIRHVPLSMLGSSQETVPLTLVVPPLPPPPINREMAARLGIGVAAASGAPTKRITSRERLLDALYEAAELEHTICCQYLFAAFSLKSKADGLLSPTDLEWVREWKGQLLMIARQEMAHLGLICNLLAAIGGAPHLDRPNFPMPPRYFPLGMSFELLPFGTESLERFIIFENPARAPDIQLPREEWLPSGRGGPSAPGAFESDGNRRPVDDYGSVAALYERIEDGFEALDLDRPGLLFINVADGQVSNESFGLPEGYVLHDMTFPKINDLASAKRALQLIRQQSEGDPGGRDGHDDVLVKMLEKFKDLRATREHFEPARAVLRNPRTKESGETDESRLIQAPDALATARLFNDAYETMLMALVRLYADAGTKEERFTKLRDIVKAIMTMVIRPLGEILTELPAREGDPETLAGPPFELGSHLPLLLNREAAWSVFRERLWQLAEQARQVEAQMSGEPKGRMLYIHTNLEQLARGVDELLKARR